MQITNFSFITFIVFFVMFFWAWFLLYKKIKFQQYFNKKYKLLWENKYFYVKYIFLFLSFIIVLFWVFWIKFWEKFSWNETSWVDVIFVLDVSKSMNVADFFDENYYYTRLDLVKKSIWEFATKNSSNRYWLVVFAWEAVSSVPLTDDNELFLTLLDWVDYKNLVKQWSDFLNALKLGVSRFTDENRSKMLVFISDWWDIDDKIDTEAIKNISKSVKWVNYYVFWVWSEEWWKIITGQDIFWRYVFQKYNWKDVISKINISNLKDISSSLGSNFSQINNMNDMQYMAWDLSKLQKTVIKKSSSWELQDFSRWLSIISLIFFIIFLILYIFPFSYVRLFRDNKFKI